MKHKARVSEFVNFLNAQKLTDRGWPYGGDGAYPRYVYDWETFCNDARRMLMPLFPKGCFFIHPIEQVGTKVMIFHPNHGVVTGASNPYMRPKFSEKELIDLLYAPQIIRGNERLINSGGEGSATWSLEINDYIYKPKPYCGNAINEPQYGGYRGCGAHQSIANAKWFKEATGIDPYEQMGVRMPGDRTVEERELWLNDYPKWIATFREARGRALGIRQ